MMPDIKNIDQMLRTAQGLLQSGQLKEAESAFRRIVGQRPEHVRAQHGLAMALERQGFPRRAAEAFVVLGNMLRRGPTLDQAEEAYRKAIALFADHSWAHANLALVLWHRNKIDECLKHAEQALALEPPRGEAWTALGLVDYRQGNYEGAVEKLKKALHLQPDLDIAHHNLGLALKRLGRFEESLSQFEALLRLYPEHAHAHFERGSAWLRMERYREGWLEYEWRFKIGQIKRPIIPRPRWDGSPLKGRSILIHTEQGMGDTFQFVRFLPMLKESGARVIFCCPNHMRPILSRCEGIDDWLGVDEQVSANFDVYSPFLSLPGLLDIDESNLLTHAPYVFPDPNLVKRWHDDCHKLKGFRVGICWQGSPTFLGDEHRSIPLSAFAPLSQIPEVQLVSLQKLHGTEQLEQTSGQVAVNVLNGLDETEGAFMDTAAVMMHLDLVVTSDTAIAHLAGALGIPVWLVLGSVAEWRWLIDRSDSPWYPSMRIFRQKVRGDWDSLFQDIANNLQNDIKAQGK